MNQNISKIIYWAIGTVLLIVLAAGFLVIKNNQTRQTDALIEYKKKFQFERVRIMTRFEEIDNLNYLMSQDPTIMNSLYKHKHDQIHPQVATLITNKVLGNIAQINHINAAYLMDEKGECIFSSRIDYIGKNYGFRPYFAESLTKGSAVYFAKGTTSTRIGVYSAHTIKLKDEFFAVSVIEFEPAFLDTDSTFSFSKVSLGRNILRTGLVTDQGIFINAGLNTLHSIEALTPQHIQQIKESKIAPVEDVNSYGFIPGSWAEVKNSGFLQQSQDGREYFLFSLPLGTTGLYFLHILQRDWFLQEYCHISPVHIGLLVLFGCMLLVSCILIYLLDRRHGWILQQSDTLAKSKRKLRLYLKALEQTENSIVITDANALIIYVNPSLSRVTGYSRAEACGRNPAILKSGMTENSVYADMWHTLNDGKPWKGILHNKKKSGELYWEETTISPIFNAAGEHTHFIAVKEDISDRISLVERMQREKEKLQLIVDHSGLGIAIIAQRRFIWCNRAGLQLFGYKTETDILGQSTRLLFPDEKTYIDLEKAFLNFFQNKEDILKIETQLLKQDGTLFWCAITGKPLDVEYQEKGYIWIVEDITKRKADEEALRHAKEQAESANSMKSRMLANISHDIRTPLHGVTGTFSLLKTTPLDPMQLKMVNCGLKASNYLLSLLNSLLDLSKIEAGQLIINEHPFSLQKIFSELDNIFSSQFKDKGITFSCHFAEDIPEILTGDSLRIQQILVNLVGNSLKFTQQGAISVSFQGEKNEEGKIKLLCRVQDSGIGIAKEKQKDLFEAFTQADNSISRKYGGTGLGLSISRELCNLMGGKIWFESVEGEGTTFYFTLLCGVDSAKEVESDIKIDIKEENIQPLNILAADDNESNRELLRMMLELDGHAITVTSNGRTALEELINNSFDLIFMDMQMPVMDGLTTAKIIRGCESGSIAGFNKYSDILPQLQNAISGTYTPIIALTGNEMKKDSQRCKKAGMDNFLTKPFFRHQLQQIISELPPSLG